MRTEEVGGNGMMELDELSGYALDKLALAGSEPAIVELETRAFYDGYKQGQQDARNGVWL